MSPSLPQKYIIKSNFDNRCFEIDQKVVDSSTLLTNICGFTIITDPVGIDCSGSFLEMFIKIVNDFDGKIKDEDNFIIREKLLNSKAEAFKEFTEKEMAEFIQEICILDSDFMLDFLADVVLYRLKELNWVEIKEYLGIEDDFSPYEREWIRDHELEYIISLNVSSSPLQFPLPCQSFSSLKTSFSSPLNAFLARVCQRSNSTLAYRLSLICKSLKNECDRYPIKANDIHYGCKRLAFCITRYLGQKYFEANLNFQDTRDEYFAAIEKRKITYDTDHILLQEKSLLPLSMKWFAPLGNQEIEICFQFHKECIEKFDSQSLLFPKVLFRFSQYDRNLDFDLVYDCLIAKLFSKEVSIITTQFGFLYNKTINLKKPSFAAKFSRVILRGRHGPKFLPFVRKYMDPNGYVHFTAHYPEIPSNVIKSSNYGPGCCTVSDFLEIIESS